MSSCRHTDIQVFDGLRCCLSCGEIVRGECQESKTVSNHSSPSPYQYKRLNNGPGNEIRLVRLYPGQNSDDIYCDLIHVNLADEPAYEALSYTWATITGDASLSQTIYCGKQTIAVTKNCEAALRSLRRSSRNRLLWIDAICINQADIIERNIQVSHMATIYSNASQVLAYLCSQDGSGYRPTNRVMEYLEGASLSRSQYISMQEAFTSFISHPYFHRIWILQEVSLARLVVLIAGDHTVHWTAHTVQILLALCQSMDIDTPSVLHYMPGIQPEEEELLDVLHRGRNSSATDPRDKVFALLGLVPPHIFAALPVEYNLSPEELFMKIALYLIKEDKYLNVLKHASSQPLTTRSPSWVPDWRVKDTIDLLSPQLELSQISNIASSSDVSVIQILQPITKTLPCSKKEKVPVDQSKVHSKTDINTLEICAENSILEDLETPDQKSALFPSLRLQTCKLDTIVSRIHHTAESYTRNPQNPRARPNVRKVLASFDRSRRCFSCTDLEFDSSVGEQQWHEFEKKRLDFSGKTATFLTEQSIGFVREKSTLWAGKHLKYGDTIWALPRVDVPFILRAVDEHYVLIGECFLYRAMLDHLCSRCGRAATPWAMESRTIDIW